MAQETTTAAPASHCVLVVDDDPLIRKLVCHHLARAGLEVIEAGSAEEAFGIVCRRGADLVITDWEMPDVDGVSLCRRIRAHPELGFFYIIMLTAKSAREDLIEALDAGTDEFLNKPVDPHELWARVRVGLRFVEMQAALEQRNSDMCRASAELARANRRLATLASHDGLTGLLNRQEGMRRFSGAWALSDAAQEPVSCIMLDIDHFKRVNDTYGHDAGDQVLVAVASTVAASCRDSDIVARLGGEEFMVVCPQANLEQASAMAERIRLAVDDLTVNTPAGPVEPTCSLGVAQRDPAMGHPQALLKSADEQLYAAKSSGRNTVRAARPMLAIEAGALLID
jgi:diguanylate cyclase (GGDEF)-like protein